MRINIPTSFQNKHKNRWAIYPAKINTEFFSNNIVASQVPGGFVSRIGDLAAKLAKGCGVSADPLDDDYFDRVGYEKQRDSEEARVVELAFEEAAKKNLSLKSEKEAAVNRQSTEKHERNRYWE